MAHADKLLSSRKASAIAEVEYSIMLAVISFERIFSLLAAKP